MTTTTSMRLTANDATAIAVDAYVFGYPLVLMEAMRKVTTNVALPNETGKAPMNRVSHRRWLCDDAFKDIVSPNADALQSNAWLDLEEEPMVVSVPEMGDRYYVVALLDAWSNVFASLGTRTVGGGKQDFAIVGPTWRGTLPPGLDEIRSPTNVVALAARIQTNGKDDCTAVHALQSELTLTPLSRALLGPIEDKAPVDSKIDMRTPPHEQVRRLSPREFFSRLNALMAKNPPDAADDDALRRFGAVGVAPGRAFEVRGMDSTVALGIERGARAAIDRISASAKAPIGKIESGWDVATNLGNYGTNYKLRAAVARLGLAASLPGDAIHPIARTDEDGKPLHGSNKYLIRFPSGQAPPVRAFWSLAMYGDDNGLVKSSLGRHAIGDRDALVYDRDGALTIYVQAESPGPSKESNWLPAPRAAFHVMLRLNWPERTITDGSWKIPGIERAK